MIAEEVEAPGLVGGHRVSHINTPIRRPHIRDCGSWRRPPVHMHLKRRGLTRSIHEWAGLKGPGTFLGVGAWAAVPMTVRQGLPPSAKQT